MKYASDELKNEHEGILFGLNILEKMIRLIQENQKVEIADVSAMLNFLKLFADKCHHGKEEGLLFPAMEIAGIKKENGPIGQMLFEHEQGRKYINEMVSSIGIDTVDTERFVMNAKNYINLLRNHITKENTILFPMGDKLLPVETQAKLLESFEEYEDRVMGKGTHEELHEMLHDFAKIYLQY